MAGALQGSLSMVGKQKMEGQVDARAPDFGQKIANTITSDRQWAQPKPGNGQIGDFRSQRMGKLETSGNPFWDMKPDLWQEYRKTSNDWDSSMSDTSPAMPDEMQENNQLLWGIDGWVDNTLEEDGGLKILCVEEALASQEWMGESPSVDVLISILHKCRKSKHLGAARCLHMHIHLNGLETQIALGNHLVQMFIECGSVSDAQQVFLRLVQRNEYSWTSLMQGYIECGESQHVFVLFQKMQEDGVYPSRYTFLILLKACARLKCVERGQEIQAEITKDGFERDAFIGNSLVDMYTKCGSLVEAREVFENLPSRNAISWNALIAGYAEHSLSEEALKILDKMQLEGTPPNAITSLGSLKACSSLGAINRGQEIHAEMAKKGHERDIFVSSTLVDTYAKCGLLTEAHKVFDGIQVRGVVSWTALIAGYAEYELGEEALNCLEEMRSEGVSPNAVTYVCSLKACGSMQAINKGRELYMEIVRAGFEKDPFVINSLIDMYAKCDLILEAKGMFDVMPAQDVVSWNTLISGYVEQGLGEEALDCWEQMQQKGVLSNFVTFVCSLKACGILGAKEKGQEVHMEIAKEGLELDSFMGSSLVDMYSNCGLLTEAQEVFDKLGIRDVVSWNALIAGYAEHGQGEEALNCLQRMRLEDKLPDDVTFMFSLKACSSIGAIGRGSASHIEIVKGGFESDPFVGNTLVDMYAKCGSLAEAQKVFDELPVQTVVLWNALIAGYSEHGLDEEVMICMENMQVQGVSPNGVTYVCILKACGSLSAKDKSRVWHADIVKEELERDQFVGSALVDTYAKCGLLAEAQGVFDELQVRDVVSWSALIAGYAVHGLGEEALSCLQQMQLEDVPPNVVSWNGVISGYSEQGESEKAFSVYAQMQEQGILPNGVTFLSILKACGSTTDLKLGIAIHSQIYGFGVVEADEKTLATGLIDMYGKCGCMVDAQRVFDAMPAHDLMRWTALVASYARQGESELVLCLLDRMKEEGIQPNEITFLKVLSVCSHAGLVEKGHLYFEVMSRKYDITPTLEHYNCMVDLLARAGQLDEAVAMLEKMPFVPNLATWTALLGACRKWGNVKLGRHAFECVVNLDSKHVVAFILMSNIYAEANMWEDVKKIEEMRTSIQALGRKG